MLIVGPCVHKAFELDHVHELGVRAARSILTVAFKAQSLAIVDHLNPETFFIRALLGGMQLKHDTRCERNVLKRAVFSIQEQKQLRHGPVMSRVGQEFNLGGRNVATFSAALSEPCHHCKR